jgi:hypothetical protein
MYVHLMLLTLQFLFVDTPVQNLAPLSATLALVADER